MILTLQNAHHSSESVPLNYMEAEEDLEDLEDEHESNGEFCAVAFTWWFSRFTVHEAD